MHAIWQSFLTESGLGPESLTEPPAPAADRYCAFLTTTAVLKLEGPDARQFMQGYFTADLDQLSPDQALFGAYCDIKGRVVADLLIVAAADGLLMLTDRSLAQPVRDSLTKYLLFSKSQFIDVDDDWLVLGLIGADAGGASVVAAPWTTRFDASSYQIDVPGAARWLCITSATAAAEIWRTCESAGAATPWRKADIDAGIAHLEAATTSAFLPQMLGYDELDAISFTKGCYLGQEVVTRAQHRGRVKRQLGRWAFADGATHNVPAGTELTNADGRRCGTVLQAADGMLNAVVGADYLDQSLTVEGSRINPA